MPLQRIILLVGILTIYITSCKDRQMITLEKKMVLQDYPSGSSCEFYTDKIYLIGDDASSLIILDKNYTTLRSIQLFEAEGRIPKFKKTDLEASTIVYFNGLPQLLIFGSASNENREKALLLTLDDSEKISTFSTTLFFTRVRDKGIDQVNIEGATMAGERLILSNRANGSNPFNQFIVTDTGIINNPGEAAIKIINVELPQRDNVIGISGLAYDNANDIILFTASTELTNDVINDGEIGDSYLGLIFNAKNKFDNQTIKTDLLYNLSKIDERFSGEKIESVTIEKSSGNEMIIHLASDNDNGQTSLFKCNLLWN